MPSLLTRYFIPRVDVVVPGYSYRPGSATYTKYNYTKQGIASFLRVRHFEHALRLTREHLCEFNAIDFGCADGPFLPSLSGYFRHVVAIDRDTQEKESA